MPAMVNRFEFVNGADVARVLSTIWAQSSQTMSKDYRILGGMRGPEGNGGPSCRGPRL